MAGFKDHFSGHAAAYAAHRPTYPCGLIEFLAEAAPHRALAWDCATGSGQAATMLAPLFDRVVATDASEEQIAGADAGGLPENVETRVATAEVSGFEGGSVDLVTVAQAMHWFDFDAFNAEVTRVLAPGGVLAVWSYALTRISPEVDVLIDRFYRGEIDAFWPPERMHVETKYREIPFPFDELAAPEFSMELEWGCEHLLAYLRTWSAVQRFIRENGRDPVAALEPELRDVWGEGTKRVKWPLLLRVGYSAEVRNLTPDT